MYHVFNVSSRLMNVQLHADRTCKYDYLLGIIIIIISSSSSSNSIVL